MKTLWGLGFVVVLSLYMMSWWAFEDTAARQRVEMKAFRAQLEQDWRTFPNHSPEVTAYFKEKERKWAEETQRMQDEEEQRFADSYPSPLSH